MSKFVFRMYKNMDITKVKEEWKKEVEEALSDNSYDCISSLENNFIIKTKMPTVSKSIEYIKKNHFAMDKPLCVLFDNGCVVGGWVLL